MTDFFVCPLRDLELKFNIRKSKPCLIVSRPFCVESIIIQIFNKKLPEGCDGLAPEQLNAEEVKKHVSNLKNSVKGIIGKNEELQFYREHLTKETFEEKRKEIPELEMLISMITP